MVRVMKNINSKTTKSVEKPIVEKDQRIAEVIKKHPQATPVMMKHGIQCVGCHAAMFETIEQGSLAHGMKDKEINAMIQEINTVISKKK